MAVLVDTGPLYALADASDHAHLAIRHWLIGNREPLVAPITVLPAVACLIAQRLGAAAEGRWLQGLMQTAIHVEQVTRNDLSRCAELVVQYADSDIGLVDASLVALAERLGLTRILTLDRRHFGLVRPRHCAAFELVP